MGGVRSLQIWCFWHFLLIWGPLTAPKNIFFEKNIFFICFTIARGIWNNFCFGLFIIFLTLKRQFFQKHGFLGNFGRYSYNTAPNTGYCRWIGVFSRRHRALLEKSVYMHIFIYTYLEVIKDYLELGLWVNTCIRHSITFWYLKKFRI